MIPTINADKTRFSKIPLYIYQQGYFEIVNKGFGSCYLIQDILFAIYVCYFNVQRFSYYLCTYAKDQLKNISEIYEIITYACCTSESMI